jgi:glycosyltransferase involved in cell wall biosynthesis
MNEPLVTIGLTCFNAEDTIRRAITSAREQTWPHREIIVVDDCSTDGSASILREVEAMHTEVRVIRHQANQGFPSAVNTLLAAAEGEFIALFDDDDESAPDRVERQHRRITDYEVEHGRVPILCYSNRKVVKKEGAEFERFGIGRTPSEPHGPVVADFVLGLVKDDGRHTWGMFGSCTLMARKEVLRAFGGFDSAFRRCAELDFAARAAFGGAHFISVDRPLITQTLTLTPDKANGAGLDYRLRLLKKHKPYLKQKKSYLGAWCNMHAQFYRGVRPIRWRLWYIAALAFFPWRVSHARLKTSSVLAHPRVTPS